MNLYPQCAAVLLPAEPALLPSSVIHNFKYSLNTYFPCTVRNRRKTLIFFNVGNKRGRNYAP